MEKCPNCSEKRIDKSERLWKCYSCNHAFIEFDSMPPGSDILKEEPLVFETYGGDIGDKKKEEA